MCGNGLAVAVPINYGMLSYLGRLEPKGRGFRRSPHQLWNALLRIIALLGTYLVCRSPHQLWNALLLKVLPLGATFVVAVPINYGMLSYARSYAHR